MDYQTAFSISAAGMDADRLRVDVAAMNLAYANTPMPLKGTPYQPLRVVASSFTAPGARRFDDFVDEGLGVLSTVGVEPYVAPPRQVYEPGHPQANRDGYVKYPGVDSLVEMMSLMAATRSYEANVAAFNAAKTMAMRALDIGSASS